MNSRGIARSGVDYVGKKRVHELKCWLRPFQEIWHNRKTAELRRDDRGYCVGDIIILREFDHTVEKYGTQRHGPRRFRRITIQITHIQHGFGLQDGVVMLSFRILVKGKDKAFLKPGYFETANKSLFEMVRDE